MSYIYASRIISALYMDSLHETYHGKHKIQRRRVKLLLTRTFATCDRLHLGAHSSAQPQLTIASYGEKRLN